MTSFIPQLVQSSQQVASRLQLFLSDTLASFEPVDKQKKEDSNMEIDDYSSSMALQSMVIPELPIANSRAGLYIYLNASV
jgi:mediator of RNA polymerase II transcription subunit 5